MRISMFFATTLASVLLAGSLFAVHTRRANAKPSESAGLATGHQSLATSPQDAAAESRSLPYIFELASSSTTAPGVGRGTQPRQPCQRGIGPDELPKPGGGTVDKRKHPAPLTNQGPCQGSGNGSGVAIG